MSQVTGFPAASQEFCQKALSSSKTICSLVEESSLSKGVAVTSTSLFFTKRVAVSFTTAKASGMISFRILSETSYESFFRVSISEKISCCLSIPTSFASFSKAVILSLKTFTPSAIRCLNSTVLPLNSSLDILDKEVSKAETFSTIGRSILRSFCCLSPTNILITEFRILIL